MPNMNLQICQLCDVPKLLGPDYQCQPAITGSSYGYIIKDINPETGFDYDRPAVASFTDSSSITKAADSDHFQFSGDSYSRENKLALDACASALAKVKLWRQANPGANPGVEVLQ